MKTMRAVIFHGPGDIRLERRPVPEPGPGEVLIKVGAALTCATDFKAYRRGHKVLLGDYPSPFGHELAGTVAAVGRGAAAREGDRVVASNSAPMDDCHWCSRGQNHLCPALKLHNGAYADYDLIPAHIARANLHALPDALPFEVGALAEPLASAVHAAAVMDPREGDLALIVGAGPMSRLLTFALRARGARVGVLGRSREGLDAALAAGAEAAFSALDDDAPARVRAWSQGRGADLAFEAVGRPETHETALSLTRDGGKLCLFGGCAPGSALALDLHRVHYRQLTLHGVFHHTPSHFREAVRLLVEGRIKTGLLIEGELPLDRVPAFFAENAEKSLPKRVVRP